MKRCVALLLAVMLFLGLASGLRAAPHPVLTHHPKNWRREVVGRWVPGRGEDTFLILNRDGTCQEAWFLERGREAIGVGRYSIDADGSVRVTTRLNNAVAQETFLRRGESLYSANGPTPWVQWHKETGPHRPPVPDMSARP